MPHGCCRPAPPSPLEPQATPKATARGQPPPPRPRAVAPRFHVIWPPRVTPSAGTRRVPAGTEAVLALCAGTATFALVAVTLAATESDLVTLFVGAGCITAIVATARFWGIAPAAPVAMAGLLAFDWFQFPPTHPHRFPSAADLAALFAYLGLAVLIGELAAHAGRRADVSEVARSALAEEQAALRRVATMVARGVPEEHLFDAVTQEVGQLLGGQAGMTRGGSVRPDDDGAVSSPIVVEGKIWGALFVHPASGHR